jgi:hypothetical protein
MNARIRCTIACIAVAAALVAAQDASAARAYNFTKARIKVESYLESEVQINPEQRSESINWSNAILVHHPNAVSSKPVCYFGHIESTGITFSGGNWLKGGNYLLVVQHGTKVSCTICDSKRKIIAQKSGWVKKGFEYTTPNRPDHGCE